MPASSSGVLRRLLCAKQREYKLSAICSHLLMLQNQKKILRPTLLAIFVWLSLLPASIATGTLINRGGGLIYDDVLDVTWTQNAGLASSVTTFGPDRWSQFLAWADALVYAGYDDWRLASMDVNGDGTIVECGTANEPECRDNEYAYMYYFNLGGSPFDDETGDQTTANGLAIDDVWRVYRFGNFDYFDFRNGLVLQGQISFASVWAVRDGDSAPVPEPTSLLIFTAGLMCLVAGRKLNCLT
jgi:hypothetical protein